MWRRSRRSATSTSRRRDYATAADWESKVLVLDPTNATAMLGLGAAEFNQGNAAEAERQWRAVLAIDPQNLEAHYDLGFMYFSQNPPDVARDHRRVEQRDRDRARFGHRQDRLDAPQDARDPGGIRVPAGSAVPSGSASATATGVVRRATPTSSAVAP